MKRLVPPRVHTRGLRVRSNLDGPDAAQRARLHRHLAATLRPESA